MGCNPFKGITSSGMEHAFSDLVPFPQCLLSYLKYIFIKMSQIILMDSVVSYGGSFVETDVASCDQHGTALPAEKRGDMFTL